MNYSYRNYTAIYYRSHRSATIRNSNNIEKQRKKIIQHMTVMMLQQSAWKHTH